MEVQLATVGHYKCAFVINACKRGNIVLLEFVHQVARDAHDVTKEVMHNFPNFGQIRTDSNHEVAIIRKLKVCDSFLVLVLNPHVVEELGFVELNHIEDLLCLLQLFYHFQIFHRAVSTFCSGFSLSDELFEDSHTLFSFTHANKEIGMQGFSLSWHTEDEFLHLTDKLCIRDTACAPPMHTEVAHRVEMTITEQTSLTPPMQSLAFFVMEEGHNSFLVVHVSLLSNEWALHLVNRLLEKFLIFSDQQFLDALQTALTLRD